MMVSWLGRASQYLPATVIGNSEYQSFGATCRGRDADCSTPPAQIRTSAFTHTALTLDAWRQSAHRDKDAEHGVGESIGSREDGGDPIALLRVDCDGSRHSATTSERDT